MPVVIIHVINTVPVGLCQENIPASFVLTENEPYIKDVRYFYIYKTEL